jgi:hypothetical protein
MKSLLPSISYCPEKKMTILANVLKLDRCPHCNVTDPLLQKHHNLSTQNSEGANNRLWYIYVCSRCGGIVTACSSHANSTILQLFPENVTVDETIPQKAKAYLEQAIQSLHAPAGSVMLTASSVDAMLKQRGYLEGSLYSRIDKAATDHLITKEMAEWAHGIRLEANDQRHADIDAPLPNMDDAQRCIDFATTLAQVLFVLPARVQRGRSPTT